MTMGHREHCPDCGHAGGFPVGVESPTVVTMECPECNCKYQMSVEKETRPQI